MKINYFDILKLIKIESKKQEQTLNFIASENYSSLSSIILTSTCLINKYTEGYPNSRYYSGCKYFDIIENKTILLAQNLFFSKFANVQPHSGSQANFSAIQSILNKNDKILSLDLKSGGHLTHGFIKNFSGKYFNVTNYCLDDKNTLNENQIELIIKKINPKILILGFSSYQKNINWKIYNFLSKKYNFKILADISHISAFICSGLTENPIFYSDLITTTTHKTLRGIRGGLILSNNKKIFNKINFSVFPGQQGGCLGNNILGKLVSFKEANSKNFIKYSKQILINSKIMLKTFFFRGYSSVINNTDNHMFLIKINNNALFIEKKLEKIGILINKNFIPNDKKKSLNPSGLRFGTSCVTTRKFKKKEIELLTNYICDIIENKNNNFNYLIRLLCKKFPIYN